MPVTTQSARQYQGEVSDLTIHRGTWGQRSNHEQELGTCLGTPLHIPTSPMVLASCICRSRAGPLSLRLCFPTAHLWGSQIYALCRESGLSFGLSQLLQFPHQPITLQGVIVAKMQDSARGLIKLCLTGFCPSIQSLQVSLQSPPTFQKINICSQLNVCKFTNTLIHVINKNIKYSMCKVSLKVLTKGIFQQIRCLY